jgi:prolyl-tRNA synthetase
VVVGRGAASGRVELVDRSGGQAEELDADGLVERLLPQIQRQRRGLLAD